MLLTETEGRTEDGDSLEWLRFSMIELLEPMVHRDCARSDIAEESGQPLLNARLDRLLGYQVHYPQGLSNADC